MPRAKDAEGGAQARHAARGANSENASDAVSITNAARSGETTFGVPSSKLTADKLKSGLYLVATPIGNLDDISLRALKTLAGADAVLCEDTRVTGKLLSHFGIGTPKIPYHDHNAERIRPQVLARLKRGESVALVSDAGTPLVSDPGYKLARAAMAEGIAVTALPGASAPLTALLLSGLPPDRFLFAGFLPPKSAARRRALEELKVVPATLLFFESAPRLIESLADMTDVLGARDAAVARELTKLFEEVRRGTLRDLATHYADAGPPKGEIVIAIGPPVEAAPDDETLDDNLRAALARASLREAVDAVAAATGVNRRQVYARALQLKDEQ